MIKFKSNILAIGLAAASLMAVSCSDSFLDVESKTSSNSGNFYKTEGDAWRALIGCYDGWRGVSSDDGGVGSFYVASTILGDECYGSTGYADDYKANVLDRHTLAAGPGEGDIFNTQWKLYYEGIYRCNELLAHENTIVWDETLGHRNLYLAEARAIRALCYFDLARLFGSVPLLLKPAGTENKPQADPAELYAAIIEDLKFAAEYIPEDANLGTNNFGRITRYAAASMLGRVYLYYKGYYGKDPGYTTADGAVIGSLTQAEALGYCEDVIEKGKYQLVDDYKNLWPAASLVPIPGEKGWDQEASSYAGDANSEVILAQVFSYMSKDNYYNDNNAKVTNRWLVMMGLRKLDFTPYGRGWGACCVTPSYLRNFVNNDRRLSASVINIKSEGITAIDGYANVVGDWRDYTGYSVKKYTPLVFGDGSYATNADGDTEYQETQVQPWVIMRYADVLLMAAELGSANADNYMHMIRERAGLADISASKENIMAERAREFAFEGIRYWDLLRQGVEAMADAVCASGGTVMSGGVETQVSYDRAQIITTKGLCPIPQDQITKANGVLVQNPGW